MPVNEVNAQTNNSSLISIAQQFINMASVSPIDYGLENSTYDNLQLSKALTSYKYDDTGALEAIPDTKYYFVLNNYEPIATLIENSSGAIMFETDTAKEVNAFPSNSFTLIGDENGIHLANSIFDSTLTDNVTVFTLTPNNSLSTVNAAASIPSSYGLSVPIKLQGNYNDCWAASVASILQYKKGTNKTALQVCDDNNIGYNAGASPDQIHQALSNYNITNSILGGFIYSISDIYNVLSAGQIPLALCNTTSGAGHAIVIRGYNSSTQGAYLSVMDPNYSSYCMLFTAVVPGTTTYSWSFSYGTLTFYWVNTCLAY